MSEKWILIQIAVASAFSVQKIPFLQQAFDFSLSWVKSRIFSCESIQEKGAACCSQTASCFYWTCVDLETENYRLESAVFAPSSCSKASSSRWNHPCCQSVLSHLISYLIVYFQIDKTSFALTCPHLYGTSDVRFDVNDVLCFSHMWSYPVSAAGFYPTNPKRV